jgi:preprotein translocase subunit Sec63
LSLKLNLDKIFAVFRHHRFSLNLFLTFLATKEQSPGAEEKFKEIKAAYDKLTDNNIQQHIFHSDESDSGQLTTNKTLLMPRTTQFLTLNDMVCFVN